MFKGAEWLKSVPRTNTSHMRNVQVEVASMAVRLSGFPTKLASSSGSSCRSWRTGRADCDAADLAGCEDN